MMNRPRFFDSGVDPGLDDFKDKEAYNSTILVSVTRNSRLA